MNTLYYGDNLKILQDRNYFPDACVDRMQMKAHSPGTQASPPAASLGMLTTVATFDFTNIGQRHAGATAVAGVDARDPVCRRCVVLAARRGGMLQRSGNETV